MTDSAFDGATRFEAAEAEAASRGGPSTRLVSGELVLDDVAGIAESLAEWCRRRGLRSDWTRRSWTSAYHYDLVLLESDPLLLDRLVRPTHESKHTEGEDEGMCIQFPVRWAEVELELERRAGRCLQHDDCREHPELGVRCLQDDPSRWPRVESQKFQLNVLARGPYRIHPKDQERERNADWRRRADELAEEELRARVRREEAAYAAARTQRALSLVTSEAGEVRPATRRPAGRGRTPWYRSGR